MLRLLGASTLSLMIVFLLSGNAFASSPRIDAVPLSPTLDLGDSEVVTVTLDEPIVCEDPGPSCGVVLNYTSDDLASVNLTDSTLTWSQSDWSTPMTFTITANNPSNCSTSELDTISATAVSNSEYYSNFQSSFGVTVNSEPPYTAPSISNQTVSLVNNGSSIDTNVTNGVSGCPDNTTISILSGPSHGTAVDPSGTITYTPDNDYIGSDSLEYSVCSLLDSTVCSTATINYNISVDPSITPDTGFGQPHSNLPLAILPFSSLTLIASGLLSTLLTRRKANK